ncbi:hypothetical protein CLV80_105264 [Yoonia maritima]|uniref:Uncharacterized protein n=1 Tax=Yoonia maritima TaxID=1435347 RepID=A0A2T0W024_9RHOB|nr:hypothetical protein [Yoonia maritima]PRY77780.1 hypothetical protein CLV80_105264 [Yoonia maritima]
MFKLATALILGIATSAVAQDSDETIEPSRITVKMMPGITSSAQLPTQELIDARKSLTQGRRIYTSQLRQIADLGDGFAALKFAEWLEDSETAQQSDIAHYYGIAAATGRLNAFNRLLDALDHIDPAELPRARSNVLEGIVFAYARAGNSRAVDAVIRYQVTQKPFGRIDSEVESLLAQAHGDTASSISLHLALTILQNEAHSPDDLARAQAYIQTAAESDSLETQLVAANLTPLLDVALSKQAEIPTEVMQ